MYSPLHWRYRPLWGCPQITSIHLFCLFIHPIILPFLFFHITDSSGQDWIEASHALTWSHITTIILWLSFKFKALSDVWVVCVCLHACIHVFVCACACVCVPACLCVCMWSCLFSMFVGNKQAENLDFKGYPSPHRFWIMWFYLIILLNNRSIISLKVARIKCCRIWGIVCEY